jgi:hypothetical protein
MRVLLNDILLCFRRTNGLVAKSISFSAADVRVHEFFKTPYFKSGIHPLPGAQTAMQKLSRFFNLSVVTYDFGIELSSTYRVILSGLTNLGSFYYMFRSRQNVIKDHTIEWIEKHFPGLFHEIHFGNHFALDGKSRPKSEICRCAP